MREKRADGCGRAEADATRAGCLDSKGAPICRIAEVSRTAKADCTAPETVCGTGGRRIAETRRTAKRGCRNGGAAPETDWREGAIRETVRAGVPESRGCEAEGRCAEGR